MIANFRVQADLKGMETTTDGRLDNHLYKIKQDIRIYFFFYSWTNGCTEWADIGNRGVT